MGEVLGLKALKIISPRPLSAGLPYELVARQQRFSEVPDTLPGYLLHLTAEFSVNGQTTLSGAAGTMGGELHETLGLYSPAKGWVTSRNYPSAGEYRAIGIDLQGTSQEQALQLQKAVETTKTILESQDDIQLATLTKPDVVGDLIYGTIFSYFALNNIQDEIAQQAVDIVSYRAPSYGIFSTSLTTQYWFGVPRKVAFSGLLMDVDHITHQTVDRQNENQSWINYNRSIGSRYSAMEHLMPEQMFSSDTAPAQGISAVKALALAAAEGQRIYTITNDNLATALNQLQLDPDTEQEIENAVYAGKVVTAHQYRLKMRSVSLISLISRRTCHDGRTS